MSRWIVGALFVCSVASAEEKPKRFEFENDVVLGDTAQNDGVLATSLKRPARERLIGPRLHFLPELIRSALDQ